MDIYSLQHDPRCRRSRRHGRQRRRPARARRWPRPRRPRSRRGPRPCGRSRACRLAWSRRLARSHRPRSRRRFTDAVAAGIAAHSLRFVARVRRDRDGAAQVARWDLRSRRCRISPGSFSSDCWCTRSGTSPSASRRIPRLTLESALESEAVAVSNFDRERSRTHLARDRWTGRATAWPVAINRARAWGTGARRTASARRGSGHGAESLHRVGVVTAVQPIEVGECSDELD